VEPGLPTGPPPNIDEVFYTFKDTPINPDKKRTTWDQVICPPQKGDGDITKHKNVPQMFIETPYDEAKKDPAKFEDTLMG
jgi:hypothetical protein